MAEVITTPQIATRGAEPSLPPRPPEPGPAPAPGDFHLVLTLRGRTAQWGGTEIIAAAQAAGFDWGSNRDLVLLEPRNGSRIGRIDTKQFADFHAAMGQRTSVEVTLDPHDIEGDADHPAASLGVLERLHFAVHALAGQLDADIVDANGQPIAPAAWLAIREQVDQTLACVDAEMKSDTALDQRAGDAPGTTRTLGERRAGWVFSTIQEQIEAVRDLCTCIIADGTENWDFTILKVVAARELCSQIGALADIGIIDVGGVMARHEDARGWLLPPAYHSEAPMEGGAR